MEIKIVMEINLFLIKTIESLGKKHSIEEDIVDILLDVLRSRIINNNEKKMINQKSDNSSEEKQLDPEKNLLTLFFELKTLQSRYFEINENYNRIEQQSQKFSNILSNVINIPYIEIQEKLLDLKEITKPAEFFNSYEKIRGILQTEHSLNNNN